MRALKIAGIAIAAVVVIAATALIVGIPSGFLTSAVQARVERETGYRLAIAGSAKIGLWPTFNVTLNDVTLQDPKDRDTSNRVTIGRVQADMTLASVWSGRPQITELVIHNPVLYVPLLRERSGSLTSQSPKPASSGAAEANTPAIERVKITDGVIVFSNVRDRVENRINGFNAEATMGGDRRVSVTGSARGGEQALSFAIKATVPAPPMERQNVPVELTLEAPGALPAPLSAKAEVRLNGSIVMINGVTGMIGDCAFNGWASVDVASKPLVKLDLDFQRLDIGVSTGSAAASGQGPAPATPWSNASIDFNGLNYFDAQAKISAAEINIGQARFAPASIDAALAGGVIRIGMTNLGAYGGLASGQIIADASGGTPTFALSSDLVGVRALPLLRAAADFDKLDGKLQAKLALRSQGNNQRAIMANMSGTVFTSFQDGAIRGLNVAQMIRSLAARPLEGWQEGREQTTDLTQLSASFRIEKGQATTGDLTLVGPLVKMTGAGTVDLAAKSLAMRVEPKLVMTTEGQGRVADPVGLGIPVVIDGPWSEPRIYPDMNGILDNPDAAYAKLKEMGKGLFGPGGGLSGLGGGGLGGGSLGGGGLGGSLGGLGGSGSPGSGAPANGQTDQLGKLGETLGNLLQQGFSQGQGQAQGQVPVQGGSRGRSIPPPAASADSAAPPAAAAPAPGEEAAQDSPAMNDVLKQLFNR